jgi:hypothetical protein
MGKRFRSQRAIEKAVDESLEPGGNWVSVKLLREKLGFDEIDEDEDEEEEDEEEMEPGLKRDTLGLLLSNVTRIADAMEVMSKYYHRLKPPKK